VSKFELSYEAVRDLDKLRRRLTREASVRVADMVEDAIFAGILECERLPMIGHPRPDIRDKSLLFYYVYDYAVIFLRQPDVFIVRVIHGARDMPNRLPKI
jgi:plasmid stabilization system protein ParE